MATPGPFNAELAYAMASLGHDYPAAASSPFICPFSDCQVHAQHMWGNFSTVDVFFNSSLTSPRNYTGKTLVAAHCQSCGQEVLFLEGKLLWPRTSEAPPPALDMPDDLLGDYEEARSISHLSPRGAAALLRLLIQKLCVHLGSAEKDINKSIGGFVGQGRISVAIQKALDAVRVIGNEAVHPGELDLRDDIGTVNSLFGLVNFIVEKMITEPKEIDEIYKSLPAGKLAGIEQRDKDAKS